MPKRKALVIGINYVDTPDSSLRGCHNDALRVKEYLVGSRGYRKEDVTVAMDREGNNAEGTTRGGIIEGILRLANASNREELDEVFIHYSGHGTQARDLWWGGDEIDGMDEALVPSDFRRSGLLRDDKLNTLFQEFHPRTRVLCVFDCCHSGSMGDLCWKYRASGAEEAPVAEVEVKTGSATPSNVVCLSGCRDDQVSMDAFDVAGRRKFSGAMTSSLMKVFAAIGSPSPALQDLFVKLHETLKEGGFAQMPVLTSSVKLDLANDRF
ncbi:MAG: caspase domain-containing protein [Halobacteriaceae archaeon]